jgi:arginyl-tRNA synthetase
MAIKRMTNLVFSFSALKRESSKIATRLLEAIKSGKDGLIELIRNLRKEFKPKPLKIRSHFKIIEKLAGKDNWKEIENIIRTANRESFAEYMSCLDKLEISKDKKEWFARVKFYYNLNKNTGRFQNSTRWRRKCYN